MSSYDEWSKVYYIRRTLIQMMIDRGYLVSQGLREETLEDFKQKWDGVNRDLLLLSFRKRDDPTDQILIFFPDEVKVGVKPIRGYCEKMKEGSVNRGLIVIRGSMTPFAKQALTEMAPKFRIEQFNEIELLVNITEHQLVPQHVKLTREEKKQLLDRYKLKESQLPRIQFSDPVARYYGLERGEVVKIIRTSETAGKYVTYRLCV